jgi:YegS/Rv2252/BmrU family lipid kinase
MKFLLVFNPKAGAGRAARHLPAVQAALGNFAGVDVLQTGGAGDAVRMVAGADLSEYSGVIAAGGDGTLFEVLNGLYTQDQSQRVPLGLIPVGTGNAFARDLGLLPGEWEKAVGLIRAGGTRLVDVGRVETESERYFFLNIVGVGLPVDGMKTAEKLKFLGNSAYNLAAFWCAMKLKSYPLSIETDGKSISQESMFLEISNTRYTGTSFLIAPDAVLDDGLLDVTLLSRLSRRRLLRLFPTIYSGRHVRYEEINSCKAKEVRITAPAGLTLAPDGELKGCTPATVTCLPKNLRIFCS